mgnify:CR=1 FL=1
MRAMSKGMGAMSSSRCTAIPRCSMIRTAFTIPEWWTLSVVPLSFALIAVEFLRQAIWPSVRASTEAGL